MSFQPHPSPVRHHARRRRRGRWPCPPASSSRSEIKLKYGTAFPADHPGTVRIKEAAEAIRKDTGGKVDLQVYPASQLGSEPDMISQTRSGAIDFMSTAGTNLQTLVPTAGINGVAFAFKDYATVWAAMDGDLGAHVRERAGQGQPARLRQVPGQRLSQHHVVDQADQHARRPEGLQDPRAGHRDVGLDVQGARRVADRRFRSASCTRRCRPRSSTARRTRSR